MSYYKERNKAFNFIETVVQNTPEGIDFDFLIYEITKKYEIGEKTIRDRLELLEKIKIIEITGGFILWNSQKKEISQKE